MLSRLLLYTLRLNVKRLWYFRASMLMEVLASLAYALIMVAFWSIIYRDVKPLPGWPLGQTFAFLAWLELFFALTNSVFVASGKVWPLINNGRLDTYLVRPVDARLLLTLLSARLLNLVRAAPSIALLFILAAHNGAHFTLTGTLAACVLVALASVAYAQLQFVGSFLTFWLGRSRVIDELTDSLGTLAQYPHTIFPLWLQGILATVLPFAFASTWPGHASVGVGGVLAWLAVSVTVTALWAVVQEGVWRKGLRRYDSFGG